MNSILLTFKVEVIETAVVVCQGQSIVALIIENESVKDVVRAWAKFLNERFDPEEFKTQVWWKPNM